MSFSITKMFGSAVSKLVPQNFRQFSNKSDCGKSLLTVVKNFKCGPSRYFARSYLCLSSKQLNHPVNNKIVHSGPCSMTVNCSCGMHSKGDTELVEFLKNEIDDEKKVNSSQKTVTMEGYEVKTDGADIKLERSFNDENISVNLNVNHSVETEEPAMEEEMSNQSESKDVAQAAAMISRPNFTVEIKKNGECLAFNCSYIRKEEMDSQMQDDENTNDLFVINEVTMFKTEWKEETYVVSGDVIDGYLYDLLMNMLEERGIGNEFASKLADFCTNYEHLQYINLLENFKKFMSS